MRLEEQKANILFQKIRDNLQIAEKGDGVFLFAEIFYQFLDLSTESSGMVFNSQFSRVSYLVHREQFALPFAYWIHLARKQAEIPSKNLLNKESAYAILIKLIEILWKVPPPKDFSEILASLPPYTSQPERDIEGESPSLRCALLEDIPEKMSWKVLTDAVPERFFYISYEDEDGSERLKESLLILKAMNKYPIVVQAIDVMVTVDSFLIPKALVIEPDYLVDVTTIAQSFTPTGAFPELQILSKWFNSVNELPIFLGNLANFLLDILIDKPKLNYQEALSLCFAQYPLEFTFLSDQEIRSVNDKLKVHFSNLKIMVNSGFQEKGIDTKNCLVEPSFFSPVFGIQGRLDLLHQKIENPENLSIVELKSGTPFLPNVYGLGHSHYIQTILYDLLIRSTYGLSIQPKSYILYSGLLERPLRSAPALKTMQYEALHARNSILAQEKRISQIYSLEDMEEEMERLSPRNNTKAKGFVFENLVKLDKLWRDLRPHEKHYLSAFMGFIAREQILSKSGLQTQDKFIGQSTLWLETLKQKESKFSILSNVRLDRNAARESEPFLVFSKTDKTHSMSNLRQGDIAVLYPCSEEEGPVQSQIFRGTIVEMTPKSLVFRLRAPVYRHSLFEEGSYWHLEPDYMDSSYVSQYRSFFQFFSSPLEKRNKILGWSPPETPLNNEYSLHFDLSEEQRELIKQLLNSKDYYLLWGPPGTGKTSFVVKCLIDYLLRNTSERILLLAFTNKAVDEIGEAILSLGEVASQQLVRMGSRYSISEIQKDYLLTEQTRVCNKRIEIKERLFSKRIWIGTVASVSGKREWIQKLGFNRLLVDEASQLLEPMLIGLLPLFPHFTLIGDHRQLPAVVSQPLENSFHRHPVFEKMGLKSLHNSLFERLILQNQKFGRATNVGRLSQQGRMLPSIMEFASKHFYNNELRALPFLKSINYWKFIAHEDSKLEAIRRIIIPNNCVYIPVNKPSDRGMKTNDEEAKVIVKLLTLLKEWRAQMGEDWTEKTCGIITPYRAQIACIKNAMFKDGLSEKGVTIDTVERFQGGAKDIILISLCLNHSLQLRSLVSPSEEGIDRKLNVALTRARRQLFVVGNEDLMQETPFYKALTQEFFKLEME